MDAVNSVKTIMFYGMLLVEAGQELVPFNGHTSNCYFIQQISGTIPDQFRILLVSLLSGLW